MKTSILLALTALVAAASAIPTYQSTAGLLRANVPQLTSVQIGDKDTPLKQKLVLELLQHVQQPNMNSELIQLAKSWNPQQLVDRYANQWVVKNFMSMYKQGMLPQGEIFQVHEEVQLKEAIALFDLLYFAKDFDTFIKTAAWARDNVNENQFTYCLCVAVLHREDCQDVVLPPLYEINPNIYLSGSDMHEFIDAKMQGKYNHMIVTNWTTGSDITNPQELVGYFTEDIALNAYNAYIHMIQPFWMNSEKYGINNLKKNRGESIQYINQQILALYNLHRMSNRLPELEDFNWEQPIPVGYNPEIIRKNGQAIPARPNNMEISSIKSYTIEDVKNIESRIKDAIDSGMVVGKDGNLISIKSQIQGINILGNIIEGNQDAVNSRYYQSYTTMLRNLVALIMDPTNEHGTLPGVLAHYQTQLRDPAYYIIQKHISGLMKQYKKNLPNYRAEELLFPGVAVKDVAVDQLVTYFDLFDMDVTRGVDVASADEADKINYVARTLRLNHKPFNVKIKVNSNQKTNAMVRVFVGPNTNLVHSNFYGDASDVYTGQMTQDLNRLKDNFVEIDRFPVNLKSGQNLIERNSREFAATTGDVESYNSLIKSAQSGKVYVSNEVNQCGVPDRLVLPKGHKAGMPLTMFVVVSPYGADDATAYYQHESGMSVQDGTHCHGLTNPVDGRPLGYPLDREIDNIHTFYTPNMYFKDVLVFHKDTKDINIPATVFINKNVNDFDHQPKYPASRVQIRDDDVQSVDTAHYDDLNVLGN